MRKIAIFITAIASLLIKPQNILCSTELEEIFSKLRKMDQWKVNFEEEAFDKSGVLQRKQGEITYQYPLTFRISYKNYYILSDGYLLHFVFPDKKKVYTKKLTDDISENLIVQILSGSEKFLELFKIKNTKKGIYELTPKENLIKNVSRIILYTAQVGFPIEKIEVISKQFGVRLKIQNVSYKGFKVDLSIPEDFEKIKDPGTK